VRLSGDEQIGIVAAMIGAGARSVLAMLWALDDSWAAALSEPPAAALGQAQRESRRDLPASVWGAAVLWGLSSSSG
jgi:CHAT domain-containing protein